MGVVSELSKQNPSQQPSTSAEQVEQTLRHQDHLRRRHIDRDTIRNAVLTLAETYEAGGSFDPAENPRPLLATLRLAQLLKGSVAAEGIGQRCVHSGGADGSARHVNTIGVAYGLNQLPMSCKKS